MLLVYVPLGYYTDLFIYRRRQAEEAASRRKRVAVDVRMFTVGPVQENCYLVRREGADRGAARRSRRGGAAAAGGDRASSASTLEAILLTHTHFDHIGAVAPVARATGAPVYCPRARADGPRRHHGVVPCRRLRARSSPTRPSEPLAGGERLQLAGFDIDVVFTPGHSPGHVTYAIADEGALFSGDVLFQGSIGRTDLPGGDHATLLASIAGAARRAIDDDTLGPPGSHGAHDARPRARDATRSCRSSRSR